MSAALDHARLTKIIETIRTFENPEREATIRELSRRTRIPQKDIKELIESDHRFNINVGIRVGNRVAELAVAEWTVEVFEDE